MQECHRAVTLRKNINNTETQSERRKKKYKWCKEKEAMKEKCGKRRNEWWKDKEKEKKIIMVRQKNGKEYVERVRLTERMRKI